MIGRRRRSTPAEPENDAGLVTEVTLIRVASCKTIAKSGQDIIKLCKPKGDRLADRNIDAAPKDEIKGVVARR
jgi:hypothetical protein